MQFDQILTNVFVGSCPRVQTDVDELSRRGITGVLNLQTAEDLAYWQIDWDRLQARYAQCGIEVRRVPVEDFNPDALRRGLPQCVAALDELLGRGHTVYVHCSAGVNRSPSTVVAYLHWIGRLPLDEALARVLERRHCDPYVEAIRLATEDRGSV